MIDLLVIIVINIIIYQSVLNHYYLLIIAIYIINVLIGIGSLLPIDIAIYYKQNNYAYFGCTFMKSDNNM